MSRSETLAIKPEIIEWACTRSGKPQDRLRAAFPLLDDWICGSASPTHEELRRFATATYTGFGFFFMAEAPCDEWPIPDLRSPREGGMRPPSPHLLDTVHHCQFRQALYSEYLATEDGPSADLKGKAEVGDQVREVARTFAATGGFDPALRRAAGNAGGALRAVADAMRDAGVLVFFGGIVGTDAARPLDPDEFHGFALADPIAPAIFVNSRCSAAEQMSALAHEFAHVIAGESGVSDASAFGGAAGRVEQWCSEVAAELLVPLDDLREQAGEHALDARDLRRLAEGYGASRRLMIERLKDAGLLTPDEAPALREDGEPWASPGVDCDDLLERVGRHYASAIVYSVRTGAARYTDIDYLLGIYGLEQFDEIAAAVGLAR